MFNNNELRTCAIKVRYFYDKSLSYRKSNSFIGVIKYKLVAYFIFIK